MTPTFAALLRARTAEAVVQSLVSFARARTGALDVAVWTVDSSGILRVVGNPALAGSAAVLGFDVLPAQGGPDRAPPPWQGRFAFAALPIRAGDSLVGVLAMAFASGTTLPTFRADEMDTVLALAGLVLERIALNVALGRAQRDAVARVGAGLAHTLGNVLQAALSSVDTARTAQPGEARHALHDASNALKRASALISQLAALGGTRGDPQPTEISALVSGLVAALEPQMPAGVSLRLERMTGETWAEVDPVALEAALAGLLHLARERLGSSGEISVSLRPVMVGTDRRVEIAIRHRRDGVAESEHPTIPNPIPSSALPFNDGGDTHGAGELGLQMARAALASYRGVIEQRAFADGGEVLARLPVTPPRGMRGAGATPSVARLRAVTTGLRVLVADDEPAVLRGMQRLLVSAGHEVRLANDGAEAVAIARSAIGVDVALVDLTMPHLGGPPLVATLRRVAPDAPVIVITGYASDEMAQALRAAGAAAVLKKPIAGAALLDAIESAVDLHRNATAH